MHTSNACPKCDSMERYFQACRVCDLLDDDTKKKKVRFCKICNAFICDSCFADGDRRVSAAVLNKWEQLKRLFGKVQLQK